MFTTRLLLASFLLFIWTAAPVDAFAPPPLTRSYQTTKTTVYTASPSKKPPNTKELISNLYDLDNNDDNNAFAPVNDFVERFLSAGGGDDPIGTRGETYFFLQATLIIAIVLGGIPILGDYLQLLAGPGLMVAGIVVLIITALNMNDSISPWPKPNGQGLVQEGLYGQMRHPMYFGLLSTMMGFSVMTGSIQRLLLTLLLFLAIDFKSNYEEEELAKAYGQDEYDEYKKRVTSKFVPKVWLDLWKETTDNS